MFILSLFISGRPDPLYLNFKFRPAAELARHGGAERGLFDVVDDFGHHASFERTAVLGSLVTDLAAEHELHGDMQVMNAKAQVAAQRKMQADPALKFAAGMMAGGQMNGGKPPFSM